VQAVLATRTAAQWEADLAGRGLMACPVRDIAGFLQSQAGDGLDLVDSVEVPGLGDCPLVNMPGAPRWAGRHQPPRAPALGEHTREILREAGIDEALIGRLAS